MKIISSSALLKTNTELTCICGLDEGYLLLNTNSSQPSWRRPIDPGTSFPSPLCLGGIALPALHLVHPSFPGNIQDANAENVTSSSYCIRVPLTFRAWFSQYAHIGHL